MRKTKIYATVGPACADTDKLRALIAAGADVLRINASHVGNRALRQWIHRIRRVAPTLDILVDLQGPRVRTGALQDHRPLRLRKGQGLRIVSSPRPGRPGLITTRCRDFAAMVKTGDPILLDNGWIKLRVVGLNGDEVICSVLTSGTLGENKGINLPKAPAKLPALSQRDHAAVALCREEPVDQIALSFVRNREDMLQLRRLLMGVHRPIGLMAKIEKPRAVTHLDSILGVSDRVMVARGDLGIEMGVAKVPMIQKMIIRRANAAGVPVITATQMLESMMERTRPSRAEVSDIANAVLDGSDAVMLSGETAIGKHPVQCVAMMAKIIAEAEAHKGRCP